MDPSRIVGTAEWYFKRWPGFYNDECYRILADYTAHPEKYLSKQEDLSTGVEETKENIEEMDSENKNRKRKVCDCDFDSEQCEHVVSV